jgi:hypothetical protein
MVLILTFQCKFWNLWGSKLFLFGIDEHYYAALIVSLSFPQAMRDFWHDIISTSHLQ